MTSFYQTTIPLPHSANPGKQLPVFGLGTWQAAPGKVETAVETALKEGYKLIDGAAIYQNEKEVGEGIRRSGVNRDDIWLTSKLWNNSHQPQEVEKALDKTLSDLGVDYLDLYLIHWPAAFVSGKALIPKNAAGVAERDTSVTIAETWTKLEEALAKGKVKNIGISNFTQSETEELLKTAKHKPDNIQLELHPYLAQPEYVKWLHSQGITVTAYSPFGNLNPTYSGSATRLTENEVIKQVAQKYNKSPASVILSWGIAQKFSVIPKSESPERIKSNKDVFALDQADVEKINAINKNLRFNDPSTTFGYAFFADEKNPFKTAADVAVNAASQATAAIRSAVGV